MIVTYDRDKFRAMLGALPEPARGAALAHIKSKGVPKLDNAEHWTDERLSELADELQAVTEGAGYGAWAPPVRTEALGRRTQALPGPEARDRTAWARLRERRPSTEMPDAFVPDWKAEAKTLSVTQADLLKLAKEWAARRAGQGIEQPKKLAEVTNYRMIAAIIGTSVDGISEPEPPTEAEPVTPEPESEAEPPTVLDLAQERMAADKAREAARAVQADPAPKHETSAERIGRLLGAVIGGDCYAGCHGIEQAALEVCAAVLKFADAIDGRVSEATEYAESLQVAP